MVPVSECEHCASPDHLTLVSAAAAHQHQALAPLSYAVEGPKAFHAKRAKRKESARRDRFSKNNFARFALSARFA